MVLHRSALMENESHILHRAAYWVNAAQPSDHPALVASIGDTLVATGSRTPLRKRRSSVNLVWPTSTDMKLEKCPYDMSPISVRCIVGESFAISCDACGAAWEMRGSSLRRLRAPDAATIKAVREGLFPDVLGGERTAAKEWSNSATC